ncbi:putative ABC transport system permease protein [Kitasatospora sp. GAS204A]|uniref:ABC transporter permease n=1 Tax=unclassified Kitasatospora TaxID=2633591 RepID=UPI0024742880|nr:FtsX-like permease family protein [Kitasatospora sp. GAS204B]MDH6119390.1 putative ABC transport system permease protein [Kitasatospora sp. GAS204B]
MSGLGRVVRSGVRRRRVQTLVTGLATMLAVTVSVLGGSLLVASDGPFDRAFAGQHGAHLTARFDASRTTAEQLTSSAHAAAVTAAAGPFGTATLDPHTGADLGLPANASLPPMTVVGRTDPGGPVDDVTLLRGGWASGPGQIVLADSYGSPVQDLGTVLDYPELPGDPKLTVVGFARSVSRTADAWVSPAELASLGAPGTAGGYQMLYRFASAGSTAQVAADRAAVASATPPGALVGAQSWLVTAQGTNRNTALFVPFLVAFGLLGVLMSVLIVGIVVSGAVGTGTRRIGILKSLGFTPAQVVRSYMGQALVPAAVGTAVGALAGNALAIPVLSATADVYGTTTSGVAPWVDVVVIGGALGLVTATAWVAALRAGRLRTVDALAVGRTPRAGSGRRAARLAARLPLPRPVSLGLAQPFARPARMAGMVAAIVFGTAAATFAVGMGSSLNWVQAAKNHDTADVVVNAFGPPTGSAVAGPGAPSNVTPHRTRATADPAAITAAVNAQAGTEKYFGTAGTEVTVPGVAGTTSVFAFSGDSSWAGFTMVSGRWFTAPGEAVVPSTFLTASGTRLGDTVTLQDHGKAIGVRLVGEVFDPHTQTDEVLTEAATLAPAEPDLHPETYSIKLKPGTDAAGYATALNGTLAPLGVTAGSGRSHGESGTIVALDALTALLTLILVATAGLGVLNTVVLETRERVREIGVAKALGMTPRQTVTMVLASVTVVGLIGGAVGLPLGLALHAVTVPAMGHSAGLDFPAVAIDVYPDSELALLGLGGVLIAVLGALLPAGWAARTRTVTALRTE